MKSMFANVPFGDKDSGLVRLAPPRLGQLSGSPMSPQLGVDPEPSWLTAVTNIFGDPNTLLKAISDLLGKIPPEVAGKHQPELDRCKALLAKGGADAVEGFTCLRNLYKLISDEAGTLPTTPTTPYTPPAPATSSFPWIPVAVGVGALGLLIFAFTRK